MTKMEKVDLASIKGGARRRVSRAGAAYSKARFVD